MDVFVEYVHGSKLALHIHVAVNKFVFMYVS